TLSFNLSVGDFIARRIGYGSAQSTAILLSMREGRAHTKARDRRGNLRPNIKVSRKCFGEANEDY
ncbi:hypothetical protein, partial [Terriglobus sp. ADX1]|uniref:hypothetical protein n=1 Tax=Terriglobus sp. ADX1 TaxID=2794063 RepID=UPI002FE6AFA7